MKICLIGAGNLGGAVARGLMRGGVPAEDITLTASRSTTLEKFSADGFCTTLDNAEKTLIMATLDMCKGNKSKAAEVLAIGRKTLHRKLDEYAEN